MSKESFPLPHTYTSESFVSAMRMAPFPVDKWEAARTSRIPNADLAPVVAAMREAHFHLIPPALMAPQTAANRTLYDLVVCGRTGVSLVAGLEPRSQVKRGDFRVPALAVALPYRAEEPLFVRPGFVVANGRKLFWDGELYFNLNDPHLTVFTYWKLP